MAIPISTTLISAFLGQLEGIHPLPLPTFYSSSGSQNLFIDKLGRATKIYGFDNQNAAAVTTNTGASAAQLSGLTPHRQQDFTRQLVGVFDDTVNEWEIFTSTDDGVNWTFREDLGASRVGGILDSAQMGDVLYLTCAFATPFVPRQWDGTSLTTVGETQSPTVSAAAGGASLLSGTYKWKLVSVEADGTRHPGSAPSTAVQLTDEEADLTWTADADTDVVGYELYRTTGSGVVYYLVDYIDGRTTASYTDQISDLEILESRVLEEHGDAPPAVHFVESHKQRMWWGRTVAAPQRIYFSDPANADSVGADNFLTLVDAQTVGDVITGMEGNFEGFLVAFQERSVWTISGTGLIIGDIQDWTVRHTNAQAGAASHRSIQRVPAGARFTNHKGEEQSTSVVTLAYWTPYGDIRLFDGENDIIISNPVKDTIRDYAYANRSKIHAYHDIEQGHIVWFFPSNGASQCDEAVAWNYHWGVWYHWVAGMNMASSAVVDTSSDNQLILTGEARTATGGFCYKFFDAATNSFNGSNIDARWMSKPIYGLDDSGINVHELKRWRWGDFLFKDQDSVTVTIAWFLGDDAPGATAFGSTTQSTQAAANKETVQAHVTLNNTSGEFMHEPAMRFRVSDNAANGSWSLEGVTLGYQILPATKRRIS